MGTPVKSRERRNAARRIRCSLRDKRTHGLSAPALLIVTNFGGWIRIGPDRPLAIVKIKLPQDIREIYVGGPVGVDRSHVSPVGARIIAGPDAELENWMGPPPGRFSRYRNDVLAEVMGLSFGSFASRAARREQELESKM